VPGFGKISGARGGRGARTESRGARVVPEAAGDDEERGERGRVRGGDAEGEGQERRRRGVFAVVVVGVGGAGFVVSIVGVGGVGAEPGTVERDRERRRAAEQRAVCERRRELEAEQRTDEREGGTGRAVVRATPDDAMTFKTFERSLLVLIR
jgi:hypothetical protein